MHSTTKPYAFLTPALLVMLVSGLIPMGFVVFYSVHDTFAGNDFVFVGLSNALTAVEAKPIGGVMSRVGNLLAADASFLAAAGVIGLVPGVILIIFMKKHLARGFSMGRVI